MKKDANQKSVDTQKNIHALALHESTTVVIGADRYVITRVDGGWLYRSNTFNGATFVPYSEQFKKE